MLDAAFSWLFFFGSSVPSQLPAAGRIFFAVHTFYSLTFFSSIPFLNTHYDIQHHGIHAQGPSGRL